MKKYLIIGLVFALLAACTPQAASQPTAEAGSNLANTKWTLVSFGAPGAETPIMEGSAITLEFDGEGQAGGSGGCNSYGAQYETRDNTLSISQITSTRMACEQEGIRQQEQSYFQALESASKYELNGERLAIWYNDGKTVLNFINSK